MKKQNNKDEYVTKTTTSSLVKATSAFLNTSWQFSCCSAFSSQNCCSSRICAAVYQQKHETITDELPAIWLTRGDGQAVTSTTDTRGQFTSMTNKGGDEHYNSHKGSFHLNDWHGMMDKLSSLQLTPWIISPTRGHFTSMTDTGGNEQAVTSTTDARGHFTSMTDR